MSMNPGATARPVASISSPLGSSEPIAAMRPSFTPTSATRPSAPVPS